MRKLKKSELKRVYGAGHDNGNGNSYDSKYEGDSYSAPDTDGGPSGDCVTDCA